MSEPFIGEIRMFGGNFAPAGWVFCEGQLLAISENDALFQLIGTTYGGDGESTFGLPNLGGRCPVHQGQGPGLTSRTLGESGGVEQVTLTPGQIQHNHALLASSGTGTGVNPAGNVLATSPNVSLYIQDAPTTQLAPSALLPTGGSQPHENRQPYLPIRFIISLFGIFPSQT